MDEQGKTNLMMQSLSRGLTSIFGDRINLKRLEREPFTGSSSFVTERIRAILEDGRSLEIFFKDLNPDNLLKEAQEIRQSGLERSQREVFMYKDVLSKLNLGTPELYGYQWDPEESIYWIFLEDAGPKRLSRLGDFSLWVAAARWVARLHAIDISGINDKEGLLPEYDASHFSLCGQHIEENLSKFNAEQQELISRALQSFSYKVDYLNNLPLCLIHGEYFGKNVIIRPGEKENTVAVIDWETAALGPRSVDLVSISAGRWTPEQRQVMYQAYAEQYEIETGGKIEIEELEEEIKIVAVYRALWWLGYWAKGDDAHISRWMKELTAIM
jgi:thiamine kinase-like enzyme